MLTASTVKKTVASLDSCINLVCASLVVDFPQTKAHEGHVITTVELDDGGRHFDSMYSLLECLTGYNTFVKRKKEDEVEFK